MGKKKNFYVVYKGKMSGVYTTWAECEEQISGFSGAEYKGYKNELEAEADCQMRTGKSLEENFDYIREEQPDVDDDTPKQMVLEKIRKLQEKIRQNMQNIKAPESVEYFCRDYGDRDASISRLSEDQKRAVGRIDGNSLLFAVPGSGKTAVIVARTGYLVHGAHNKRILPKSIMNLTFSRKAAMEMHERYYKIFPEDIDGPGFRTIHSFCLVNVLSKLQAVGYKMPKALLGSEYTDPDTGTSKKLTLSMVVREALRKAEEPSNVDDETCQNISAAVTYIKNNMLEREAYNGKILYLTGMKLDVARFFDAYEEVLHDEHNAYDFDDMLLYAYEGLQKYPEILENLRQKYKYWSIDEAQDNSLLQYKLLNLLTAAPNNLFMVGDDDQSIYSFRGAKPQLLLDYGLQENTAAITMGINYRSDCGIVNSARYFIEGNSIRADKDMLSFNNDMGEIKFYTMMKNSVCQYNEIAQRAQQIQKNMESGRYSKGVPPMAILYKHHYSAVPVAFWLHKYDVGFRMSKTMGEIMRGRIFCKATKLIDMLANPFTYKKFMQGMDCIGKYQFSGKPETRQKKKLKQLAMDNPKTYVYRLYFQAVYDDIIEQRKAAYEAQKAKENVKEIADAQNDRLDDSIAKSDYTEKLKLLQKDRNTWYTHFEKIIVMSTYDALDYMLKNEILAYSDNISDRMRIYGLLAAAEAWPKPKEFIRAFREICYSTDMNTNLEDDIHDGDMTEEAEYDITEGVTTEIIDSHDIPVAVDMMTMHSSKGLQYDKVALVDCLEERQREKPKDAFDTEDPEELRRLYYVAMTRAKHELSIFVAQKYYGNIEQASRFIGEMADIWEGLCQEQVVQYESQVDKEAIDRICQLHKFYAVVRGYKPGIYASWEECEKNVSGFRGAEYQKFDTRDEAEKYYYGAKKEQPPEKLSAKFLQEIILPQSIASFNRAVDLPCEVNRLVCAYLGADKLDELASLKYEPLNYANVGAGGVYYSDEAAKTYLISYLPMHFYKIYLPLSRCLQSLPQQNAMIMEIGPGPGTSTLAMIMFYASLAKENPQKRFSLEIRLIEKAPPFVKILKFMLYNIKAMLPVNMTICGVICAKDLKEGLQNIGSDKFDLIYESNVFNKNESADSISYDKLAAKLIDSLKKSGHGIFIEPNYNNLGIWKALQTNDGLYMEELNSNAKVNVQGIALQSVALKAGIRYKNLADHAFSYAVCKKI